MRSCDETREFGQRWVFRNLSFRSQPMKAVGMMMLVELATARLLWRLRLRWLEVLRWWTKNGGADQGSRYRTAVYGTSYVSR